jgi:enoyl-CoA hydratase
MQYEYILSEQKGSIQLIQLNREDKLNALNIQLIREIGQEISRLNSEKKVSAIIITGKGQKAFAAGADISEFSNFNSSQAKEMSAAGHQVFQSIENSFIPVIAAVNGFALGGGCELTLACHVRIASENAKFGQPEVNLGVPPGYGGTQRLPQIIGKGRALDVLISAKTIDAQTALSYGLVSAVVPTDELIDTAVKYGENLSSKSPYAMSEVIKCVNALYGKSDAFQFEIDSFSNSFGTSDFIEGTTAFLEKRKPEYRS